MLCVPREQDYTTDDLYDITIDPDEIDPEGAFAVGDLVAVVLEESKPPLQTIPEINFGIVIGDFRGSWVVEVPESLNGPNCGVYLLDPVKMALVKEGYDVNEN